MSPYSILFMKWFRQKYNVDPVIDNAKHEALSDAFEAGYGWGWKMHAQETPDEEKPEDEDE